MYLVNESLASDKSTFKKVLDLEISNYFVLSTSHLKSTER